MFSTNVNKPVKFVAEPPKEKSEITNSSQTEALTNEERGSQVFDKKNMELNCRSISWNCTGTCLAVAYAHNSHESWCDHDGSIIIWSMSESIFEQKNLRVVIDTLCCVTFVAFHPTVPTLLVAGNFNGRISVWNISKGDDSLLGRSAFSLNNHCEPITGLFWLSESDESIQFCSCSLDGKILKWKLEKDELIPIDGFIILSGQLPRNFQIKTGENSEVGIVSMSINHEDSSIFVMGIDGGGILQGSFKSLIPVSYSGKSSVDLKNPIIMFFERHKGQVTSVQFSTFSRNIFLSSGSDGEVRIYTLLQTNPIMVILSPSRGVNAAAWSIFRPMVLSCICSNGELHFWDLMTNSKLPRKSFKLDPEGTPGLSMQYSNKSSNFFITSSSKGAIQLWKMGKYMQNIQAEELQQLQNLSKKIE